MKIICVFLKITINKYLNTVYGIENLFNDTLYLIFKANEFNISSQLIDDEKCFNKNLYREIEVCLFRFIIIF